MNALDLLIDFTTLISISVEPTSNQDESASAYVGSSHDAGASLLASEYSLPFEQYHSLQQGPEENTTRDFSANPLSRHILSPSANYIPDCEIVNPEHQGVGPSSIQHNDYTSQVFDPFLEEPPNIGPPPRLTSVTPQPWPQQQPEASPQWNACYETNSTLSSVPDTWYTAPISCAFEPTQHGNTLYHQVQIPCNDNPSFSSQCWTQSERGNYPAEDDVWPTWGAADAPFDCGFLTEYNERIVPGAKLNAG